MLDTKKLTFGALFIALGVFLPMAFHALGLGKVFLPMHIPVLLAGFLCGPVVGAMVGGITPLLSALLTGMPPLMPPMAQMMIFELGTYGALTGIFYKTLKGRIIPSLLLAMMGGRLVYGFLGYALLPLLGLNRIPILYPITGGLLSSLPGVILQIIIVPTTLYVINRAKKPLTERAGTSSG